jgi:hypothetical protein
MEERVVIDVTITAEFLQRAVDFICGFLPGRLILIYHCINIHVISSSNILTHTFVDR